MTLSLNLVGSITDIILPALILQKAMSLLLCILIAAATRMVQVDVVGARLHPAGADVQDAHLVPTEAGKVLAEVEDVPGNIQVGHLKYLLMLYDFI